MGVWIETYNRDRRNGPRLVTPCMGVWIETVSRTPSRFPRCVTPCMGVWIETGIEVGFREKSFSHTLYGCVD